MLLSSCRALIRAVECEKYKTTDCEMLHAAIHRNIIYVIKSQSAVGCCIFLNNPVTRETAARD